MAIYGGGTGKPGFPVPLIVLLKYIRDSVDFVKIFIIFAGVMVDRKNIVEQIRQIIKRATPSAEAILYGSQARGDARDDSDIDVLILLDAKGDKLSKAEEDILRWPLYELELKTGVIISPLILSKSSWYNRPFKTPFYVNVMNEGIRL